MRSNLTVFVTCLLFAGTVVAEEPAVESRDVPAAVVKAVKLLEAASAGSAEQRECFTCHSQALPVMAFAEARNKGIAIDEENFTRQVQHTVAHLERGRELYKEGKGQGGRADTAGYALWTLSAAGRPADDVTAAVTDWMLRWHSDSDHWKATSTRPPTSYSDFTTTYLVLRGLSDFATPEQQEQFTVRKTAALEWLRKTEPTEHEDRVFRLWCLQIAGAETEEIERATQALWDTQQPEGGWRQKDDMAPDAYATATALAVLHEAGGIDPGHEAYQRGVQFLLSTQLEDGSWHVVTRSKPFQLYFETGFPHGADQFVSTAATAWAVIAILPTLNEDNTSSE